MFTGLVDDVGIIDRVADTSAGREFVIRSRYDDLVDGESIAVNGACLTVRDRASERDERRSLRSARLFRPGFCIVSAGRNSILHLFTAAFRVARLKFSPDPSAFTGGAKMGTIRRG